MKMRNLILLSFIASFLSGCWVTTGPTEVGVMVNKIGIIGKVGVSQNVYGAGQTHLIFPVIQDFYQFETAIETIDMTMEENTGDESRKDDLDFKTTDGNDISLDLIIRYQVIPDKTPFILEFIAPNSNVLKRNIVRAISRSRPRDLFGELSSEDFYVAQKRTDQTEKLCLSPMESA